MVTYSPEQRAVCQIHIDAYLGKDINLKDSTYCELFFKSRNELQLIKSIKNAIPMFSSCGFGIYSFFRDNKKVFESSDVFLLGKAGYNMKIRIVDRDKDILKDSEEGIFAMRGKNIFSGFWNDPFMTSSYFQKGFDHLKIFGLI